MEKHLPLKILLGVFFTTAIIVLFQQISFQFSPEYIENSVTVVQAKTIPTAPKAIAKAPTGLPIKIQIPSIKVNTVIRYVGLAKDGSMGVPSNPSETAWYTLGPKPGETGSAVIAGHVNWWYGAKGVFEHLNDIKKGAKITVLDDKGKTTTFIVRSKHEYGQNEDASSVFISDDGTSHLNLVTCAGIWNKLTKSYSKRLVVFADKVIN